MALNEQCQQLEAEYRRGLETLRCVEDEIRVLHCQIMKQSEFSYRMASVLGSYVSKASEDPATLAAMIADPAFEGLMKLAMETIVQVGKRGLTKKSEEDGRFIMSLLGVLSNVARDEGGRRYLLQPRCQDMVDRLVQLLLSPSRQFRDDEFEACSFKDYLKLSAMQILSSLGEDAQGAAQLSTAEDVFAAIRGAVRTDTWNPIRKPALRLLQRLLDCLTEQRAFARATQALGPLDYYRNLQMCADEELKAAAEGVVKSLDEAQARFTSPQQGDTGADLPATL
ncbi:uncharacterized protein LOC134536199 [Bacillus rossius redtenbacheri]|uniref:uncharacterized protein LOC134536199 n=1 Tax=Bacillus rossius redtenbacheri TaxID=93214 RepID=UPI002FDC9812